MRDLIARVKALLPKGHAVALREKGPTEQALARLNAQLPYDGYVIRATKGRHSRQRLACLDEDGRVQRCELFELQRISPKRP